MARATNSREGPGIDMVRVANMRGPEHELRNKRKE